MIVPKCTLVTYVLSGEFHEAWIKLLVEDGKADVNGIIKHDMGGQITSPLACAVRSNHGAAVEYLLAKGADVNVPGINILQKAIKVRQSIPSTSEYSVNKEVNFKIIEQLLKAGADVSARFHMGMTVLDQCPEDILDLLMQYASPEAIADYDRNAKMMGRKPRSRTPVSRG